MSSGTSRLSIDGGAPAPPTQSGADFSPTSPTGSPPKFQPGTAQYSQMAASPIPEQLLRKYELLARQLLQATKDLNASSDTIRQLQEENKQLRSELTEVKVAVNRQATYLTQIDSELDSLAQYGRRENVVFSNISVAEGQDPAEQIISLCKEIDVEVEKSDIVDAHVLPSKSGTTAPRKFIARFHQRSKAKEIFTKRRKTKEIAPEAKRKLAANPGKGFAIQVNLTPKRAKLLAQAQDFCDKTGRGKSCWVDYRTGNILVRPEEGKRGTVIRCTRDLVSIDDKWVPTEMFFCSFGYFEIGDKVSSPPVSHFGNPGAPQFDPYVNYDQDFRPPARGRGGRGRYSKPKYYGNDYYR